MSRSLRQYCSEPTLPVVTVFVLLILSGVVFAQDHSAHMQMMQQKNSTSSHANISLPDAVMVTQEGENVSLTDDVIGDRIVVVDFVYTTCTTVCPVLSAIFTQVQHKLGERVGDDVIMVSISVDPLRDTPARMKSYASKLGAGEGWVWLTGQKQTVTEVLVEFGAYTPNFEDHPSMILVGDGNSGQWARYLGFPASDQIVEKVNEFSADRMAQQTHAAMMEKQQ